jgi:hypothetical protein
MTIRLKDGSTLQHVVEVARTIAAPLSNEQIVAKYRTLTDGIVEPGRQSEIAERILALETLKDTSELTRLLAPSVGAAFR